MNGRCGLHRADCTDPNCSTHGDPPSRWYPHLDYSGEPMAPGEFRDPQPDTDTERRLRNAAIIAVERFCAGEGFDVPPLAETDSGRVVQFVGTAPDGRQFHIGYERYAP